MEKAGKHLLGERERGTSNSNTWEPGFCQGGQLIGKENAKKLTPPGPVSFLCPENSSEKFKKEPHGSMELSVSSRAQILRFESFRAG